MTREDMKLKFAGINAKLITARGMEDKTVVNTLHYTESILNLPENLLCVFDEEYFELYKTEIEKIIANRVEKEGDK